MDAALPANLPAEQSPPGEVGYLMPFRYLFGRKANLAILLVLFVLMMVFVTFLLTLLRGIEKTDQQRIEILKIVGITGLIMGQIAYIIRIEVSEYKNHKSRHDILNKVNAATLTVQAAGKAVEEIDRKLNGNLDNKIDKVFEKAKEAENRIALPEDGPVPPCIQRVISEAVNAAVDAACIRIAGEASRQTAERMSNVQRPDYPPRPQP